MDEDLARQIQLLVDEEHRLMRNTDDHPMPTADDHERLKAVEVQLDQCWDLLRQRRARRQVGQDADDAAVRDGDVVEHYRQ
jgi:hypothetical protein